MVHIPPTPPHTHTRPMLSMHLRLLRLELLGHGAKLPLHLQHGLHGRCVLHEGHQLPVRRAETSRASRGVHEPAAEEKKKIDIKRHQEYSKYTTCHNSTRGVRCACVTSQRTARAEPYQSDHTYVHKYDIYMTHTGR